MRKLIVLAFLTLDGVVQGDGGPEEDPTGERFWTNRSSRLNTPARRRCSSYTMSIWFSPTPILARVRSPPRIALVKNECRKCLAVDKGVCQFGLPNDVKYVTVRSPKGKPNLQFPGAWIRPQVLWRPGHSG